ncbi:helix-turn-helix domain-containing protein [Volucribacter amazonae]|uniref:Transcriptional regulator n=1 Tax=Volucribacter amazonae TaxID=256731 RepID=A0A9X4SIA5_9PAST|nr:helix-turn-helix transcriptional regulator [Volucribacter amazonae]MDG6895410.1 transcriptional regulator [Volucribacter amazonae]
MAKLVAVDIDKAIGKRIQLRRRELGYSADKLSELIGISQQQLSRYERGANKINVAHLVNIAVYLDTPISWFFLDCKIEDNNIINPQLSVDNDDLKIRLHQHWENLSNEQKKNFIKFLDSISPIT